MRIDAPLHTVGNQGLLELHKVAFLCSRNSPAAAVKKAHDWAILQRERGVCVISGFHSRVEREVFDRLLEGKQPVIMALAHGIRENPDPKIAQALDLGRLLIVTRYAPSVTHACEDSCYHRNRLMMEMADETVIAYASPGGKLERLYREFPAAKVTLL